MKIVFQHDHILPVLKYGGIERILYWHMKQLAKLGHHVVLIGHPESQLKHAGIEVIPMNNSKNWRDLIPVDTDMVHLFYNHIPNSNIPTINSIQGNGKHGETFIKNSVFASRNHAENHQASAFVYNCLDLDEYPFPAEKTKLDPIEWNQFLFMANGSWKVKNLKSCIKACRKNKKHLHIGGGRSLWPSPYIHSYGMVGGQEKLKIMKQSDVLLFPVRWPEPFGIAIIEAMALGLAVIGSPYGSLPELISPEVGVIVKSHGELENIIAAPPKKFHAVNIRKYIESQFAIGNFTNQYLNLYHEIQQGRELNPTSPHYSLIHPAQKLLPF